MKAAKQFHETGTVPGTRRTGHRAPAADTLCRGGVSLPARDDGLFTRRREEPRKKKLASTT